VLHVLGGLSNDEIAAVFAEWNQGELQVRPNQHLLKPF
jgi:6-phosphogluconate dehydrogenase